MKTNVFNSKRFLSLFLTLIMMFSMLPMTTFATGEVANVWVGGQQMTVGGSISDSSGGTATLTKDGDKYILTLDNFSYEGEGHVYADGYDCAGIYAEQNLIINLKGTNTINVSGNRNSVHGIAVRGYQTGLIIDSGDQTDSLTATSDGPEFVRCIYAENDLTIQGNGTVTAQGGSNTTAKHTCVGIGARQINLSGNGKIYAIGGNSDRSSSGIEMEWMMSHGECLNISGNVTVMASGGIAGRDISCGIAAPNANITGGKVTAIGSKVTGEEKYDSIGIFLRSEFEGSTLNIQNSTVTAIGDSFGIQVRSDFGSRVLNIQNSTVTAESSNQAVDASISTGEEQWYQWRDTVEGSFNNGPLNYNQNSYLQICPVPLTCNLWVGGVEVTPNKTSGEGWCYDQATGTLTLNGASITSGSYADAIIYTKDALNIVLNGNNTLSGSNFGIYADSSVNISGDGHLTAVGHWDGIQAHGNVTVNSGSITFKGESSYGIKAEGNTLTVNGGYVTADGGINGSGINASTVVLGSSSHLVVTHKSAAVWGTINAADGLCRTSADGDFSNTIAASGTYFEYMGSDHVTYTYKDAQEHTISCVHGISCNENHTFVDDKNCLTADVCLICGGDVTDAKFAHTYDNDHDTTCNVDGCTAGNRDEIHTWATTLTKDDSGHWYACSGCDEKKDYATHSGTADANCTTATECVCSHVITPAGATHTYDNDHDTTCNVDGCTAGNRDAIHIYGTDWKSDKDNHWHECSCGDKKDTAAHTPKVVNAKEATSSEKGYTGDTVCEVCGYEITKGEDIPVNGTSPATGDNSNMFLWIALLFISGSAMVTLTVVDRKRKAEKR